MATIHLTNAEAQRIDAQCDGATGLEAGKGAFYKSPEAKDGADGYTVNTSDQKSYAAFLAEYEKRVAKLPDDNKYKKFLLELKGAGTAAPAQDAPAPQEATPAPAPQDAAPSAPPASGEGELDFNVTYGTVPAAPAPTAPTTKPEGIASPAAPAPTQSSAEEYDGIRAERHVVLGDPNGKGLEKAIPFTWFQAYSQVMMNQGHPDFTLAAYDAVQELSDRYTPGLLAAPMLDAHPAGFLIDEHFQNETLYAEGVCDIAGKNYEMRVFVDEVTEIVSVQIADAGGNGMILDNNDGNGLVLRGKSPLFEAPESYAMDALAEFAATGLFELNPAAAQILIDEMRSR